MLSFKRSGKLRGASLIEVMVSQVIAITVIASLSALVVAMVQKLNSETNVSDAQIRLRQATHLLLRDTQGIGGDVSAAGDMLTVIDGGANGPDQFTLFKRDESVCGGGVGVESTAGVNVTIDDIVFANGTSGCPVAATGICTEDEIEHRRAMLVGPNKTVDMTGHNARESNCKFNFPSGQQADDIVAAYNQKYDPDVSNINQVLSSVFGNPTKIFFGSTFTYRLNGTTLQRSTDGGATFVDVLTDVFDLQVERVYNVDGTLTPVAGSTTAALPAGASADNFLGIRIGIITFGRAADGMEVRPPASFSNRNTSSAPGKRRYRASFIFSAARNRTSA